MQQPTVNFGFITGFVLNIGETATIFWFKYIFLEFALVSKGLHIVSMVSIVEEFLLCYALVLKLL